MYPEKYDIDLLEVKSMQPNQNEIKKILNQGMVTRTIIESEVTMKKCNLYKELAENNEVKNFFEDQAIALEGVVKYFKNSISNYV